MLRPPGRTASQKYQLHSVRVTRVYLIASVCQHSGSWIRANFHIGLAYMCIVSAEANCRSVELDSSVTGVSAAWLSSVSWSLGVEPAAVSWSPGEESVTRCSGVGSGSSSWLNSRNVYMCSNLMSGFSFWQRKRLKHFSVKRYCYNIIVLQSGWHTIISCGFVIRAPGQ